MRRWTMLGAALALVAACGGSTKHHAATTSTSTSTTASSPSSTPTTTAAPSTSTTAAAAPNLAAVSVKLTQVGSFRQPVDLEWCAGHPDPFVVQKTGQVRNTKTGQVILDLSAEVSTFGEQGLLGMACSPAGNSLFVDYTTRDGKQDRVDVFAMPADGAAVDMASRLNILAVADPAGNHNGGNLVIGPDGKLWYGLGDGGGEYDVYGNGQNPNTLLSKIVRFDLTTAKPEVVVSGARNPWRFSFDRQTGDLWIGDVGQDHWEEIDLLAAGHIDGANLGWSLYEGTHRFHGGADPPNLVMPVFEYSHREGQAVTGGYVYRGHTIASLRGVYVFADAYTAVLRAIVISNGRAQQRVLGVKVPGGVVSSFAEDPNGELYALSLGGGIFRIDPA